jgi:hypothetical protein
MFFSFLLERDPNAKHCSSAIILLQYSTMKGHST